MPFVRVLTDHPTPTRNRGLLYQFHPKHHGAVPGQGCWRPELALGEEFAVFDLADVLLIQDAAGNLYGMLKDADGEFHELGTHYEQVAEFPFARPGERWHGYPSYPLGREGREGRRGDVCKPPKAVLETMVSAGLLTESQRGRLASGRFL